MLYTIPTGDQRQYGTVRLPGTDDVFPELAVKEGWLKVRDDAKKRTDGSQDIQALIEKEDEAKAASKGVWGPLSQGEIDTEFEVADAKGLVEEHKDRKIDAIVEQVVSGDRVIVRLLLSPTRHLRSPVALAGIRAPKAPGKDQPGEPFGDHAQQFVEARLLQRKVAVLLLGTTPQGQLVGTVLHPNGNIARFLLDAGLGRCFDPHSTLLGAEMGSFRQAEKIAKESKKGLFTGHVASKSPAGGSDTDYVVSRVMNADTLFLRNKAGAEKKVSLSSIRQPKPSDPNQAPFAVDAKEYLRKKLIGKHVKVTINGKKPASEGFEEREVATLIQGNTNIAMYIVEAGYASVIRHRQDDDDRSPDYDALLAVEETAKSEGKGMWSSKPPKNKVYQDYSESLQKAKLEVSILQRQKKVPAIVDFVKSASRFTVLVPRENAKLTFVLSGIRAPRSARGPSETSEPFGQEAHEFANRRCMQRDVEIDVENLDKVGGFIGTLYLNRENFAKLLVEEGLATVHTYSAEQSGHGPELIAAEKKAKEGRKGLWHDWDPSKDQDEDEGLPANGSNGLDGGDADGESRQKDYRDVMVTHIDPESCKLKVQQIGSGTSALTELMNAFRSFHLNKPNAGTLPGPPKVGEYVAAQFTEDNEWYRARVRRNDREKKQSEVVYVDYGNSEVIPWSRLRPLTQPQFSVQKLKPQASDAVLSFLQFPTSPEYLADAVQFIGQQTFDRQLVANVDFVSTEGTLHITLLDPALSKNLEDSINAEIIREGAALIPRKLKTWERAAGDTLVHLRKLEEEAKQERRGMWEYGDLTED